MELTNVILLAVQLFTNSTPAGAAMPATLGLSVVMVQPWVHRVIRVETFQESAVTELRVIEPAKSFQVATPTPPLGAVTAPTTNAPVSPFIRQLSSPKPKPKE